MVDQLSPRGRTLRTQHPPMYVCPRTVVTPRLTGKLDDDVWGHAPWTEPFEDIEGDLKPKPRLLTRAKMLWDDEFLYVGAYLDEPHLWGTLTEHDCIIYEDNDFEVFLDLNGTCQHYVELELNLLNTTWDLMLTRPYRAGGIRFNGWEFHGMRTAVHCDGTLNDPSDIDKGWSVEIAFPWASLADVTDRPLPPSDGDQIRIGFSRVEWQHEIVDRQYRKVPGTAEDNWVWTPTGVIDMHRPERWGVLQFSDRIADLPEPTPLTEWENRVVLVDVFEAQMAWQRDYGAYTSSLTDLGMDDISGLTLEATASQFIARLGACSIDHEWRLVCAPTLGNR